MQALKPQSKASRWLALLAVAGLVSIVGCGSNDGGKTSNTADAGGSAEGGIDTPGGGSTGTGGTAESGGDTATGGSADGGAGTGSGGTPGPGGSSARGGSPATGGGSARGGAGGTSSGGTSSGGTSSGGTSTGGGGGVTGARSCERDCMAIASTACAGADFTQEKCVTDCQKAFQSAAADAKAAGCLNEFLALDACRVNDPVCTHPNPRECVPENNAYIQCLQNSI